LAFLWRSMVSFLARVSLLMVGTSPRSIPKRRLEDLRSKGVEGYVVPPDPGKGEEGGIS
jgi:hypothetical protein